MKNKKKILVISGCCLSIVLVVVIVLSTLFFKDNKNVANENNTDNSINENLPSTDKNNNPTDNKENNNSTDNKENGNEINLNKYLKVEFTGYSGAGYGNIKFDKEQFYLDNISIIDFKDINSKNAYYELTKSKESPIDIFYGFINNAYLTNTSRLKNNDEISIEWKIKEEEISKYFAVDYKYSNQNVVVKGLTIPEKFDPMNYINVSYSGTAPYGYVKIDINVSGIKDQKLANKIKEALYRDNFEYSSDKIYLPNHNLKVRYKAVDLTNEKSISNFISRYGLEPTNNEKTFTLKNYDYYVTDKSQIPSSFYEEAKEKCKEKISSDRLIINKITEAKSMLMKPSSLYSYSENDWSFYFIYKIDATASFLAAGITEPIKRDITYYYILEFQSLIIKNNTLTYSKISDHANVYSTYETQPRFEIWVKDGVISETKPTPYSPEYKNYSYWAYGFKDLKSAEDEVNYYHSVMK